MERIQSLRTFSSSSLIRQVAPRTKSSGSAPESEFYPDPRARGVPGVGGELYQPVKLSQLPPSTTLPIFSTYLPILYIYLSTKI